MTRPSASRTGRHGRRCHPASIPAHRGSTVGQGLRRGFCRCAGHEERAPAGPKGRGKSPLPHLTQQRHGWFHEPAVRTARRSGQGRRAVGRPASKSYALAGRHAADRGLGAASPAVLLPGDLNRLRLRLARRGPGADAASTADTPGSDASVTAESGGQLDRTSQRVCPARVAALRPPGRADVRLSACRGLGSARNRLRASVRSGASAAVARA